MGLSSTWTCAPQNHLLPRIRISRRVGSAWFSSCWNRQSNKWKVWHKGWRGCVLFDTRAHHGVRARTRAWELVLLKAPSGSVKWVLSETDGGQDPETQRHTDSTVMSIWKNTHTDSHCPEAPHGPPPTGSHPPRRGSSARRPAASNRVCVLVHICVYMVRLCTMYSLCLCKWVWSLERTRNESLQR